MFLFHYYDYLQSPSDPARMVCLRILGTTTSLGLGLGFRGVLGERFSFRVGEHPKTQLKLVPLILVRAPWQIQRYTFKRTPTSTHGIYCYHYVQCSGRQCLLQ